MTIEKRTEPATVTRDYYICDICGDDSRHRLSNCYICGRHVCDICKSGMKGNWENFGILYCNECYKIKSKYDKRITQIEKDCECLITTYKDLIEKQEKIMSSSVAKLKEAWKNEALSLVNNNED